MGVVGKQLLGWLALEYRLVIFFERSRDSRRSLIDIASCGRGCRLVCLETGKAIAEARRICTKPQLCRVRVLCVSVGCGSRSGRVAKDGCDRWAAAYSGQLGCLETVCGSVRGKKSTRSVTCDARRTNGATADARRCLSSAPAYRGGCAQFINRWASCFQRELPGSPPLGAGRCDRPVDWRRPVSSVAPTHDALFLVASSAWCASSRF